METYEVLLQQFGKKGDLYYVINIKRGTCSCPDCSRYHMVCKHLFAVFRQFPQWSFSDLPTSFTGAAHMILDAHVTPELDVVLRGMAAPPPPTTTTLPTRVEQPRVSASRRQLTDVLSTLVAAAHSVEEEELNNFLTGALQLQQQFVKPPALFVEGTAPPKGSRAAAANHLGSLQGRGMRSRSSSPMSASPRRQRREGPSLLTSPWRRRNPRGRFLRAWQTWQLPCIPPLAGRLGREAPFGSQNRPSPSRDCSRPVSVPDKVNPIDRIC